jgi:hypothetical protein
MTGVSRVNFWTLCIYAIAPCVCVCVCKGGHFATLYIPKLYNIELVDIILYEANLTGFGNKEQY